MWANAVVSRLILSAGVLITTVASLDAQEIEAPWQGELTRGPYTVGFRTESLERTTVGDASRELTLSVWYPATPGSGQSARLEDFFEVALDEGQLSETNDLPRARALVAAMTGDSAALPQGVAERALATATFANLDAEQADGRFPLALWSSRHATVLAQAPLSETLASHGIIIATVWTSDPPLAFIWEDHPENLKLETIEQQTADLEIVLSRL